MWESVHVTWFCSWFKAVSWTLIFKSTAFSNLHELQSTSHHLLVTTGDCCHMIVSCSVHAKCICWRLYFSVNAALPIARPSIWFVVGLVVGLLFELKQWFKQYLTIKRDLQRPTAWERVNWFSWPIGKGHIRATGPLKWANDQIRRPNSLACT